MPAVRRRLFRWVSLSPEPAHTRKERRAIEHNAEAAAAVLKKPSRHNVRVGRLTLTGKWLPPHRELLEMARSLDDRKRALFVD
jgi:uncharacterized protein (DUF58 family)